VERVGHVRAFGALASLSSVAAIVHLISADPLAWGAMRFLTGFCFPGLYVITEAWLNAKTANRSRALVLSIYFVVQTLGASLGQGLAGYDDPDGTLLFGLCSILISLSLVPLLLSRNPAPAYEAPERLSAGRLLAISPMAVSGAVLNGAAQAGIYVAVPLYGLAIGLDPAQAAFLLVTATVAGAVAQFPVGWISDRMDRRIVVAVLCLVCLAAALVLAMGAERRWLTACVAVIGAATLPVYSLCVAHANDQLTPAQIVPASGTLVLALNVGVLAGAFAGPAALSLFGPSGLPLLLALLAALTAVAALFRRSRSAAPERTAAAQPISVQGAQQIRYAPPEQDGV
jgi:MFS family permease